MSEEEKKAIEHLEKMKEYRTIMCMNWSDGEILLKLINKQQKLINIFIHNEAVREGKDFNEIKEKYYECL